MFNIDLEKKIKDLNEGTYYKTLNGKSYEIHVKNTEHGNKVINVYYKSNLIIDLNYYKDGKIMKEGIEMKDDDKNYSLNEIINKMINLSEGYAKLDNMSICVKESKKIDDSSSTSFKVEIEDENYNYDFSIPFTNEYYINIKSKNMDFNFFTKKDKTTNEIDNRSITFIYKDKKYALTSNTLTNLYDEKKYIVQDNNLITKIDEKYYIAYDFTNNKVYVYIKKNDAVNNDLENDYIKIPYAKNLNKVGNVCNELFNVFKNKVKDKVEDKEFNNLIDRFKLPTIDINLDSCYDEINEMAVLVKTYGYYLNLLDNEVILNNLYNLVSNANITVVDTKINEFKDKINKNSLKDLNTLKGLKKQINEIIKLKKKQDKTKKKILKNTDIEN